MKWCLYGLIGWCICLYQLLPAQVDSIKIKAESESKKFSFRDPVDGAIDLSDYILKRHGFLFIPFIITEPAIGYGGGGAVLFFQQQKEKYGVKVPPNISGVVGMGTQNGTWLGGLFHFHVFGPDKIRYLGGFGKPYININYYGNNNDYLDEHPVELNMSALALVQRVQVRVAKTNLFVGGSYVFYTTTNTVDSVAGKPVINEFLEDLRGESTLSMLQPMINWDSRNNIFTPLYGINTGLIFSYNAIWLGADVDFYKLNTYFLGYEPLSTKIFTGWRFDASFMLGDAPLYALPYIQLRGVPAMRHQSDNTMLVETEWRYAIYKRWSIDVFTGAGKAFTSFDSFSKADWVQNYGGGFRYELARVLGMHSGMDFAWSNDKDFAFYFIFGTAWLK
jgi:hypothetical protein